MSKSKNKVASQEDISFRAISQEMFRRKYVLLGVTLLAGIAAGVLSSFLPNQYESSAALTIRKLESPIQGEPEPLNMETLQQLAESTDVKWALFEQLWDAKLVARWMPETTSKQSAFENFQSRLFTEIKRQESRETGGAVALLPVLRIRVESESPEEAQTIANEWLKLITQRYETYYTEGVDELAAFVTGVFDRADDKLLGEEQILTETTNEADLDLKQARFEDLRERAIALEQEIFELDVEILTNEAMIEEIAQRIAEREHEGVWLGSAAEDAYLSGEKLGIEEQVTNPAVQRILQTVGSVVEKSGELQEFTTASRLETLKSEASALDASVRQANETIADQRIELAQSESELEFVTATLAEQEVDGLWIGELLSQYYRDQLTLDDSQAATVAKPPVTAETARLDTTIQAIVQREYELLKFIESSEIEFKRTQLETYEQELASVLADKERSRKALAIEMARLEKMKPELESQPQKISLDKAITDDALWEEYLRGEAPAEGGTSVVQPLKTEFLNPVHQLAQEQIMRLNAEVESLKEALAFSEEREQLLPADISRLREETSLIEMELLNRQDAIETLKSVFDVMRNAYAENKEKQEELTIAIRQLRESIQALELARDASYERYRETEESIARTESRVVAKESNIFSLRASLEVIAEDFYGERTELETLMLDQARKKQERQLKGATLDQITEESELLQVETAQIEQELKKLSRDVAKLETVRTTFATRAEEMELLKTAAQDSSRSGMTVLYRAQANPEKLSPSRPKIVLASMVAALLFCGFLIFASKVLEAEPRESAALRA
jgi:capsular polysaccharide biosynthesis protein